MATHKNGLLLPIQRATPGLSLCRHCPGACGLRRAFPLRFRGHETAPQLQCHFHQPGDGQADFVVRDEVAPDIYAGLPHPICGSGVLTFSLPSPGPGGDARDGRGPSEAKSKILGLFLLQKRLF